jgi:hypothetical protein
MRHDDAVVVAVDAVVDYVSETLDDIRTLGIEIGALVANKGAGVFEDMRDRLSRNLYLWRIDVRIGREACDDAVPKINIALWTRCQPEDGGLLP